MDAVTAGVSSRCHLSCGGILIQASRLATRPELHWYTPSYCPGPAWAGLPPTSVPRSSLLAVRLRYNYATGCWDGLVEYISRIPAPPACHTIRHTAADAKCAISPSWM